ncbi:MAG TPA: hypothetical protein PKH40_04960 [Treponemataceae bacterium]|nr:MAG: hypothetical protein BWY39_02018 [Spirochaetes bacterium ADurb.Bin269]TAH55557.1 MAG: hypothetical protein EWM51_02045 [Treponema sp.]HOC29009.1 hypothetical protein [Treponemataceae bacterium]HPX48620.1 hypothetical protein [Treponemataceae bacterium]HQL33808.1 hypothetical protein [Treponemataceae bacterium]
MNKKLQPCPFCGSTDLDDCHSYIRCNRCFMCGPKIETRFYSGVDLFDFDFAAKIWNDLPRKAVCNA